MPLPAIWAQVQVTNTEVVLAASRLETDIGRVKVALLGAAVCVVAFLTVRFHAWKAVATVGLIFMVSFAGFVAANPDSLNPMWKGVVDFLTDAG